MRRHRIALPEIDQDVRNYTRAVNAAGMEPVVISVETHQIHSGYQQEYLDYDQFNVDAYDGLLLPGGGDVDPHCYGREDEGKCMMIMRALDELQLAMLDDFVRSGKPVLGICRGHQLINVYFGGTLIQHLPDSFRHFRKIGAAQDKRHYCTARPGSWLADLYGETFPHNSAHHQAVDILGKGLVADSWCPEDGCIESMHHESLPIYSVQWHPERMSLALERSDMVNGLPVLRFFSSLCAQKAGDIWNETETPVMNEGMGL